MTYKTILVHVNYGERAARRLKVACELASRFGAHLVGFHAVSTGRIPLSLALETGLTLREHQSRLEKGERIELEDTFVAAAKAAGIESYEFRASPVDVTRSLTINARYADLSVLGQAEPGLGVGLHPGVVPEVVMASGRPVLVIPYAGEIETLGKRVLVAWNGGREATRAITDALPLLKGAEKVDVAVFNPKGGTHGDVPGADIGLWLARHGVKVNVMDERADDIDVGNLLLSRVTDRGSDLIVMGAYGRSRFAEFILGGVTQTILESMTVPVLMAN
ncbi:MAG: universal stress protein [Burkholderiales bacterium]|nr:universal stress protein [Burkholderiales bacterium]